MTSFANRRVLVTGASGFIGSHLCAELERRGATLLRASRSLGMDFTDSELVDEVISKFKPQSVFHLASRVTGARHADEVLPTFRNNLLTTLNVLSSAHKHDVERVLCTGSLQEPDFEHPGSANSPYAASKAASTLYARMFASLYALPVTVARTFMVYGPGQADTSKVLPYVISQLLDGQPAELSNCRHSFDWVHVRDVVKALFAIHDARGIEGKSVDVGTGCLTATKDVVSAAAAALGAEQHLRFGVREDREGEPLRCADVFETKRLTGWSAEIKLNEGIQDTVSWYQARRLNAAG